MAALLRPSRDRGTHSLLLLRQGLLLHSGASDTDKRLPALLCPDDSRDTHSLLLPRVDLLLGSADSGSSASLMAISSTLLPVLPTVGVEMLWR